MITKGEFPVNNELERKSGWEYLLIHLSPHGRKAVIPDSLCLYSVLGGPERNQPLMKINIQAHLFTAFSVSSNTKESHKGNKSLGSNT
jgi:hypothetical protein